MNKANDYESTMSTLPAESKEITDGGCLDKADMDGVEKTANALSQRWNAVDKYLEDRRKR